MDLQDTAVVLGVVELIKKYVPQVSGVVTVVVAALVGAALAYVTGKDYVGGAISGLGAVGVHTAASTVGGK